MVRWIVILVIVVVAVPALLALVGSFLPKAHVATTQARFAQAPGQLWGALADFPRWPEWNPAIQSMERDADRDGKPVWVATGKWGRMPQIVETFDAPRRLVTRIPEDAELGFSGSWSYEIASAEGGSVLSITEHGEVSNPIFRLMGTMIFDPHETARQFLRALGQRFGETLEPEVVPRQRIP